MTGVQGRGGYKSNTWHMNLAPKRHTNERGDKTERKCMWMQAEPNKQCELQY